MLCQYSNRYLFKYHELESSKLMPERRLLGLRAIKDKPEIGSYVAEEVINISVKEALLNQDEIDKAVEDIAYNVTSNHIVSAELADFTMTGNVSLSPLGLRNMLKTALDGQGIIIDVEPSTEFPDEPGSIIFRGTLSNIDSALQIARTYIVYDLTEHPLTFFEPMQFK